MNIESVIYDFKNNITNLIGREGVVSITLTEDCYFYFLQELHKSNFYIFNIYSSKEFSFMGIKIRRERK